MSCSAILVMLSVEVLVTNTRSGGQSRESCSNNFTFRSKSSGTASITRSVTASSATSAVTESFFIIERLSASVIAQREIS